MSMFTRAFWRAAAERAVSTFAQGVLGAWGADYVPLPAPLDDIELGWSYYLASGAVAAAISVLKSLAVQYKTGTGPSLVKDEVLAPPAAPPDPSKI